MEVWLDVARQDAGASLTSLDLLQKGLLLEELQKYFFMASEVRGLL